MEDNKRMLQRKGLAGTTSIIRSVILSHNFSFTKEWLYLLNQKIYRQYEKDRNKHRTNY